MIRYAEADREKTVAAVPARVKLARAREAVAETKPRETKPNRGGRPRKHTVKPWEAEGVSKATWHRRQKAKK